MDPAVLMLGLLSAVLPSFMLPNTTDTVRISVFFTIADLAAFIAVTTKVLAEMGEERVGDGFLVKVISFLVRNVRKHFIHLEGRVGTIQ